MESGNGPTRDRFLFELEGCAFWRFVVHRVEGCYHHCAAFHLVGEDERCVVGYGYDGVGTVEFHLPFGEVVDNKCSLLLERVGGFGTFPRESAPLEGEVEHFVGSDVVNPSVGGHDCGG